MAALIAAGSPAKALVINPIFDPSWASAPAAATTDVKNVIAEYEADFSNPVTVNVAFGWGGLAGKPITSGAATTFPSETPSFSLTQVKSIYNAAAAGPGATAVLQMANTNLPAAIPIRSARRASSSSTPNTWR